MSNINAIITGVAGYVPDYVLNNEELSRMVDTNDEWITTRTGIKERRILTEEGLGTSYMARKAAKLLMKKTGAEPDSIDAVVVATTTPDYPHPSTASIVLGKLGLKNAFAFDLAAACCGFMIDSYHRTDGKGLPFLHIKAGGSVCPSSSFTVDHRLHYTYQEGRTVFRYAVTAMGDDCEKLLERNGLTQDDVDYVVCHQANLRIIEAVAKRIGVPMEKVLVNIQRYGNTSAACMPLVLWDFESKLKKGDKIIFTGFGAGFVNGAAYFKWAYDGDSVAVKK